MKKLLILALLSMPVLAQDVIINESGYHIANDLQKAVFVSVFLPEDMVCSQPVHFVTPEPEPVCTEPGNLVISPGMVCAEDK